jgi:hypothetical protein
MHHQETTKGWGLTRRHAGMLNDRLPANLRPLAASCSAEDSGLFDPPQMVRRSCSCTMSCTEKSSGHPGLNDFVVVSHCLGDLQILADLAGPFASDKVSNQVVAGSQPRHLIDPLRIPFLAVKSWQSRNDDSLLFSVANF